MAPIAAAPQPVAAPRLVDEKDHGSFRLQRLVIEAMPGWSVGLDLFLPAGAGPFVPVLCPCGHGPKWLDDHQIAPQVLARSGFAAALFDMPMFGERRRGNCHFVQGAASAMVGRWSGFYFLLDIIRTADYLATRPDITMDRGIGVTGVSGGGIATLFMPHLDGRVRAIVPVCCTTSLGGHIARGLYTGCQEGYMEGQAAAGLDLHHLMALAAPTPCLVLAGGQDTLFRRQWVEQACLDSRAAYSLEGAADHFAFAFEDTGHHYTAAMAHQAAAWFAKWLSASPAPLAVAPAARHPATAPSAIKPLTEAQLDCGTADATLSMLDCTRQLAAELRQTRAPAVSDDDLRRLLHIEQAAPAYEVEEIPAASEWGHPGLGRFVLHRAGDRPGADRGRRSSPSRHKASSPR
jgi:hypothetical protein